MEQSRGWPIEGMYVDANGTSTYVERRGRGWPVVLIHALGMSLRSWDPVAEALAEDFEVVAYDYCGHGRTEKVGGPSTIPILAEHLRDLLGCLALGPVHLVGLAVGSMIAQQLAIQEPRLVSALVLASPRSELDPRGAKYNEERADTVEAQGMRAVMGVTIQRAFPYCTTPRLHEIRCPTLLLAGELDQLCPAREAAAMHSRIAGSRCETLPGVGHFSAIESPAEVAQRVLAFLRSLPGRAH
jgi:3-oxoadipate enol-lactonase